MEPCCDSDRDTGGACSCARQDCTAWRLTRITAVVGDFALAALPDAKHLGSDLAAAGRLGQLASRLHEQNEVHHGCNGSVAALVMGNRESALLAPTQRAPQDEFAQNAQNITFGDILPTAPIRRCIVAYTQRS